MCNEELIKTGKVEVGITPSEISGKKSTLIKNGSAVAPGEVKKIRKESDLDIPIESD